MTQKKAIAALAAFATKLKPYDMELRLELVKDDAEEYAAGPRPPAPKPSPAKKGKKAEEGAAATEARRHQGGPGHLDEAGAPGHRAAGTGLAAGPRGRARATRLR